MTPGHQLAPNASAAPPRSPRDVEDLLAERGFDVS
jgi:hypothetical protein